jgi:probable rRNA maturation factor
MIVLEPPRRLPASANPWDALGVSREPLMRFLLRARKAAGLAAPVDVLLASDASLKKLNREFRGKDKATDVLSFPATAEIAAHHSGDLAVSVDTAARQAKAFGHTLDEEIRILMLHGLLHLAGMDHEADGGEMAAREAELRGKLKLPVGLIQRAAGSGGEKRVEDRRPGDPQAAKKMVAAKRGGKQLKRSRRRA